MFKIEGQRIPGLFQLISTVHMDARGRFIKTFHEEAFERLGLCTNFRESYYSVSERHVLRGMHFQAPPYQHDKLVCCVMGTVLDVVLDLRKSSPAFGESLGVELSAERGNSMYVPAGLAHGFLVLSESATVSYSASTVYAPSHDAGIRWDSFGFRWPVAKPLLSERDTTLPQFSRTGSPFG
ncbi:MAG: dTDP-4-dehydrorhamnose 3,5-epimerase [Alphaproteobacteria bacterium]